MRMIRTDLRQMNGITRIIGAMCDCWTVGGCPQLDSAAADCGRVEMIDLIVRRKSFPPDELSAGRDRIYTIDCSTVWGFPHIDSAEVPLCHHLLPAVSRSISHEVEAPFHSPLCRHSVGPAGGNVFAEWSKYDLVISLDSPRCRHPVWPDGGSVFAELDISLYDPCLCVCR